MKYKYFFLRDTTSPRNLEKDFVDYSYTYLNNMNYITWFRSPQYSYSPYRSYTFKGTAAHQFTIYEAHLTDDNDHRWGNIHLMTISGVADTGKPCT
jgi:hypothetical protein